jgi:WD40 repeat protein
MASGSLLQSFRIMTGTVASLAFNPDSTWLAAGGRWRKGCCYLVGTIHLWTRRGRELKGSSTLAAPFMTTAFRTSIKCIQTMTFNDDGSLLAASKTDGSIVAWHLQHLKGGEHVVIKVPTPLFVSVAFDPGQSSILAVGGRGFLNPGAQCPNGDPQQGEVQLWTTAHGSRLIRSESHPGVQSVVFSPKIQMPILASAGTSGTIQLWNVTSWLSDNPTRAVRGSSIQSLENVACSIANRNLTRAEWKQYLGTTPRYKVCPGIP